jgi:hypothetical protein
VTLAGLSLLALSLTGCGGGGSGSGSGSSSSSSGNDTGNPAGGQATEQSGAVVMPNGSSGVAIVQIEDANGNLLSTPTSVNLAAAEPVLLVAEPPDFSQGVIAGAQSMQTLNTAASSPQITDDVALPSGSGAPLSVSVIADTTFSVLQTSQLTGYLSTCFTGGLHLASQPTGQGNPQALAYVVSPDGTGMVAAMATGGLQFSALSPMTGVHGENIDATIFVPNTTRTVTGRGAIAWDPGSDTVLAGGPDGSLTGVVGLKSAAQANDTMYLPNTPAVASIAFAPSGQYAVVATAAGLFTVTINVSTGTSTVIAGPVDPSYMVNGGQYEIDGAQSIAITADGNYLVALTDEPSATAGTLVAMPIDAAGNVGTVGVTLTGFLATQGVDDLFVH